MVDRRSETQLVVEALAPGDHSAVGVWSRTPSSPRRPFRRRRMARRSSSRPAGRPPLSRWSALVHQYPGLRSSISCGPRGFQVLKVFCPGRTRDWGRHWPRRSSRRSSSAGHPGAAGTSGVRLVEVSQDGPLTQRAGVADDVEVALPAVSVHVGLVRFSVDQRWDGTPSNMASAPDAWVQPAWRMSPAKLSAATFQLHLMIDRTVPPTNSVPSGRCPTGCRDTSRKSPSSSRRLGSFGRERAEDQALVRLAPGSPVPWPSSLCRTMVSDT